ncbi:MAG: ArsR/SmtB family transcription factor [Promethearchaeota archaeon]
MNHPIYDVLSNKTRLEILRIIACEHNYGSRIASILNVSAPAIHRHLKFLSQTMKDQDMKNFTFINPSYKTTESFSGYKGAEATIYEIGTKIYLSFALYPNFTHSHIYQSSVSDDLQESNINPVPNNSTPPKNKPFTSDKENKEMEKEDISYSKSLNKFSELYKQIQVKNQHIRDLEEKIIEEFEEKNKIMKEIDKVILEHSSLNFDERVSLRALACQGSRCLPNLPELLKKDVEIVKKVLRNIKSKGWFDLTGEEIDFENLSDIQSKSF